MEFTTKDSERAKNMDGYALGTRLRRISPYSLQLRERSVKPYDDG